MKCPRREFEVRVKSQYPHKYLNADFHPSDGRPIVMALDTAGECQLPFYTRLTLASHVWYDGQVTCDTGNIFSYLATHPVYTASKATFTFNGVPIEYADKVTMSFDPGFEITPKKCKCGSHSVGSNRHSDYCDLYEKY